MAESNKNIPTGTILVPISYSGQPTHYYLVHESSGLLYSALPRTESGAILLRRKDLKKLRYGTK